MKRKPIRRTEITTEGSLTNRKVAIYTRVSTKHQVDKDSLGVQQRELIEFSRHILNIDDYVVFEDAGYSATTIERPRYQDMLHRIKKGEFSHLLVWKIDRISRNLMDFVYMYNQLEAHNVIFISKMERFDTSNAIGIAMLRLIMVFAELESQMTSERVSAVLLSRAEQGLWNGGKIPYGYEYDKQSNTFCINKEEANVIRYVFDAYEVLKSCDPIARRLNEKAIKTKEGCNWAYGTIRNVIKNPFYTGKLVYNQNPTTKQTSSVAPTIISHHHPSIIAQDKYEVCNSIMQNQAYNSKRSTHQAVYCHVFSGLIYCSICGNIFGAQKGRERNDGWKYSVYACIVRRKSENLCGNPYTSDLYIGPFVFQFILNLLKARKKSFSTPAALQMELLRHNCFKHVLGIVDKDLQELHELVDDLGVLFHDILPFESVLRSYILDPDIEKEKLLTELQLYRRARGRINDLYSQRPDIYREAEYLEDKEEIDEHILIVEQRLSDLSTHTEEPSKFAEGIQLLNNVLCMEQHLGYSELITRINPWIMKEFMIRTISEIRIKNRNISSIQFKNGLNIRFNYN